MYYALNEKTGKIYEFQLFEKWWYYLLLWFAWFLPHKFYELEEYEEISIEGYKEFKKGLKKSSGIPTGIAVVAGGIFARSMVGKEILIISDKFAILYYLIIYSIILFAIILDKKFFSLSFKKKHSKSNPMTVQLNIYKSTGLKKYGIWLLMLLGCIYIIYFITVIDTITIIVILFAIFVIWLISSELGLEVKYSLKNRENVVIGGFPYILDHKKNMKRNSEK